MPNHNSCIVHRSAEMLQVTVLIVSSDVRFLNDATSYCNPSCYALPTPDKLWWTLELMRHSKSRFIESRSACPDSIGEDPDISGDARRVGTGVVRKPLHHSPVW